MPATKAASAVDGATAIRVRTHAGPGFASRGGHKLAGALRDFGGPDVTGDGAGSPAVGPPVDPAGVADGRAGVADGRAGDADGRAGDADGRAGVADGPAGQASAAAHDAVAFVGRPATVLTVTGRRCLDAGASTGGFSDVLLRAGARGVVAVDVGYGQLAWSVRSDHRVTVLDRTNVRALRVEDIGGPVQLAVADLSFISLTAVLPALGSCVADDGDLIPMVKPQFEVGRARLGKGGVVREPQLRAESVLGVCAAAADLGWGTVAVARSRLPGPSGNVEFFLWLRRDALGADPGAVGRAVHAVAADPGIDRQEGP